MVERRRGLLLAFEHAQPPVQSLLLERLEFGGEIAERIATHRSFTRLAIGRKAGALRVRGCR